mmetsp:Transcript_8591/g.16868  ORF Transcript_8591/g.16868 Transcript_8591/m.16868 type:complete len:100 (+) Transcript_8591:209-508(+)
MYFPDGAFPPRAILARWRMLVQEAFFTGNGCVAVHCMAGLGRAPLLVALSLIDLGCEYQNAVRIIRTCRPGSINAHHIGILKQYRKQSPCKQNACCLLM